MARIAAALVAGALQLCLSAEMDLLAVVSRDEVASLLQQQELHITRLQAQVSELSAERTLLQQQVRLLNATTATAGSVSAATHGSLKAEVRRLLARLHAPDGPSAPADEAGAGSGRAEDESPWSRPQQVSLTCKETEVDIRPLEADDRVNGECMVLRVMGGDVAARFVLYCDAGEEGEEEYGGA
jgi:hypothetical protein